MGGRARHKRQLLEQEGHIAVISAVGLSELEEEDMSRGIPLKERE